MESKKEARGRFRELRVRAESRDRTAPGRALAQAPEIANATLIASFQSYGDEPDTFALHEQLRAMGKRIFLPRMNSDKTLTWLENGSEVPVSDLTSIDVVILPALAIDLRGVRLGQGGGSFDRTLPQLSGWKVALIDSVCLSSEDLPEEEYDVRVDAAATEMGITRFN
jgi:5-formyltetrahydrofolate cyclo-ligase